MQKVIISDTSCIVQLYLVGELDILQKLFGQVIITREIELEFRGELPEWFSVSSPANKTYQKILEALSTREKQVQSHWQLNTKMFIDHG